MVAIPFPPDMGLIPCPSCGRRFAWTRGSEGQWDCRCGFTSIPTQPETVSEAFARKVFRTAIEQERAAELLEALFDGATVTLDAVTGELVIAKLPTTAGGSE